MHSQKNKVKKIFLDIIATLIGSCIMAFGVAFFLQPNKLSSGGVTGIATLLYHLLNIPMGVTIIVLNIPLFIMSIYKLGKEMSINSIVGIISLSVLIDFFDRFSPLTNDKLLACIYGGILVGTGTAVVLKVNSSTGGTELFSQLLKKYNSNIQSGVAIAITDIVVVVLNMIFLKEFEIGLYSAVAIYICGKMVDIMFEGINFTKLCFIISNRTGEIAKEIGSKINRGSTGLYGKGMYTNENKLILMCAAGRGDVAKLRKLAKSIDPECFIIITNSREVFGEGFKKE